MGDDGSGSDGKEKEGREGGTEHSGMVWVAGGHGIQVIQLTANRRRGGGAAAFLFLRPEFVARRFLRASHILAVSCNVRLPCATLHLPKDIILLCETNQSTVNP